MTKQYLLNALAAVVAGERLQPARIHSLGCTIKFRDRER